MSYRRISRRRVAYRRSSLSRQATRAVTVLGGMLSCVMVPPNGSDLRQHLLRHLPDDPPGHPLQLVLGAPECVGKGIDTQVIYDSVS
jgi:hypothetical protein